MTAIRELGHINQADVLLMALAMWHVRAAPKSRAELTAKLLEPVARQVPLRRFVAGVTRRIGRVLDAAIEAGMLAAETDGARSTDVISIGPEITAGELDVMFTLMRQALGA